MGAHWHMEHGSTAGSRFDLHDLACEELRRQLEDKTEELRKIQRWSWELTWEVRCYCKRDVISWRLLDTYVLNLVYRDFARTASSIRLFKIPS